MIQIMVIVAVAKNRVIGAQGDMPWHVPSDQKHFKALTMGKPMIMGRKTFQSLPGLLPGRPHLVISRDATFSAEGAETFATLKDALERGKALAQEAGQDAVSVIGGGQIYAQALALATRVELTELAVEPQGDTYFPDLDPMVWMEAKRVTGTRTDKDTADFAFVTYVRREGH